MRRTRRNCATIRGTLEKAGSFDEFASLLLRDSVAVRENRGRLSYLTPKRTKPLTARKLWNDFDHAAVLAVLEQDRVKAIGKKENPFQTHKGLQRLVDREAKRAKGQGIGYDRWAMKHNHKQMAKTVLIYEEQGVFFRGRTG